LRGLLDGTPDHELHQAISRDLPARQDARVAAVAQHGRTVGQRFDLSQAMRDVDDGGPVLTQIAQHGMSRSASPDPRLAVGSSRTSRRAFIDSARAIATNCCCAVDSRPTIVRGGIGAPILASCRSVSASMRLRSSRRSGPPRCGSRPRNTLAAASSVPTSSSSWWMMAMPSRAASAGPCSTAGTPSMAMTPESAR
jgi:hypothetical protein